MAFGPRGLRPPLTQSVDVGGYYTYRDYGIGAQILRDLDVGEMILLTSSSGKLAALQGFGLSVVARQGLVEPGIKLVAGAGRPDQFVTGQTNGTSSTAATMPE